MIPGAALRRIAKLAVMSTLVLLSMQPSAFALSDKSAGGYLEKTDAPDTPFSDAAAAVKNRPIGAGVTFSLGGSLQHRYQALDNRRDFTYSQNDEDFSLLARERLNLDVRHEGAGLRAFFELQDAREFFRDDLPGTNPNQNALDIYQAFVEYGTMIDVVDKPALLFRFGRQEFTLGKEKLFSDNDWLNTGQSYDMGRIIWRPDGFQIDAYAGWPVVQDHNNFDAPTENVTFAGLNLKALGIPRGHVVEGYANYKFNEKTDLVGERGIKGPERLLVLGGRADGRFLKRFDYDIETNMQFGERGEDNVRAWFGAV
jgi:hypothetical protein